MSATMRTLKLNLLADVTKFGQGLNKASKQTMTFNQKVAKYAKIGATAFLGLASAVGIASIKLGMDAVKAAAEDELSQKKLAKALQNTTKATSKQISATEKWITSQQLSKGIADTKLRPALANLARVTKDVTKAQDLTTLAMDISAATGKDLETVSLALSKAYGGNLGALKKLGIPLDESIIKSKDFNAATTVLSDTFGGAATANTETYAGKMAILSQSMGEIKEQIGTALMPYFMKFTDWASSTLVPTLQQVADGFSGKPKSVSNKLAQVGKDLGYAPDSGPWSLGNALRDVAEALGGLFKTVVNGDGTNAASTMQNIADSLESIADGIDSVSKAWNSLPAQAARALLNPKTWLKIPSSGGLYGGLGTSTGGGRAMGGSVRPGTAYRVGEFGPETLVMGGAGGRIVPKGQGGGGGNTFIFNGVIDGESARRSIERLLQSSARRTGEVSFTGRHL